MIERLEQKGVRVKVVQLDKQMQLQPALKISPEIPFTASSTVKIDIRICLPCGPFRLRNVEFLITDQDMNEVLLGRPLLKCIDFDLDKHLEKVRAKYDNLDVSACLAASVNDGSVYEKGDPRKLFSLSTYKGLWYNQGDSDPIEQPPCVGANIGNDSEEEIQAALSAVLKRAKKEGMSELGLSQANSLLSEYRGIMRIKLGADPPANVEPFRISLKAGATPFRSTQRRYAPPQRAFISSTIRSLAEAKAVYYNPQARWASPALAVPKPGSENYRFTVDLRGPNRETIPIASAMPDLESMYASVAGSSVFAKVDMCHAYWQIPLHEDSRELMSIQTPIGVYTPTRILQGSTGAGNHFQSCTSQIFAELSQVMLQWLDDFLLHANSEGELLRILRRFFELCRQFNLKLHAEKLDVFLKSAKFCGRIVDADGVRYDPAGLECLINMRAPERGGDLQQFLCATNWMRTSIPNYSCVISPLHKLLERVYSIAGKRTKRAVRNVQLAGLWGADHLSAFEQKKKTI